MVGVPDPGWRRGPDARAPSGVLRRPLFRADGHEPDPRTCEAAMDLVRGLIIGVLVFSAATGARAQEPWATEVRQAAQRVELPAELVHAVLRAESAGNPRAVSRAGAMGLM